MQVWAPGQALARASTLMMVMGGGGRYHLSESGSILSLLQM